MYVNNMNNSKHGQYDQIKSLTNKLLLVVQVETL